MECFYYEWLGQDLWTFINSSVLEIFVCLILVPREIVKQRQQVSSSNSQGCIAILRKAKQNDGIVNGVYRGYGITLLLSIVDLTIKFIFDHLFLSALCSDDRLLCTYAQYNTRTCAYVVVSVIMVTITMPLDVTKTIIQVEERPEVNNDDAIIVFKRIYRLHKMSGLFAGFLPRLSWEIIYVLLYRYMQSVV